MKALPWFRLYAEAVDDEKLRLLAFEDRWHFVAILCCKASGVLDGEDADLRCRKVAVKLGLDLRELGEVARRLEAVGLVCAATLQPLAWDERQFLSDHDPTAAVRQKKWREKKKLESVTDASRVTSRIRNGRVTASEQSRTDTETEQREKRQGSRFTLAQLPPNWSDFCKAERPDLDPALTFARFSDFWKAKPGKDGVKLDWLATWRNWVRAERAQARRTQTPEQVAAEAMALMERRHA